MKLACPQFEVRSLAINGTGHYHYTATEDYEEGFVMSGDIQVEDQIQSSQTSPHLRHRQIIPKRKVILLQLVIPTYAIDWSVSVMIIDLGWIKPYANYFTICN